MKLIGTGHTAEAYECEEGKVCKLFFEWNTSEAIERECHNAMIMHKFVQAVPRCYGIIEVEGRKGIVYDEVCGKTLLEKFFEDGDEEFMINTLTDIHKSILACHTTEVMKLQAKLAEDYLVKMRTTYSEVEPYIDVIRLCRKYE